MDTIRTKRHRTLVKILVIKRKQLKTTQVQLARKMKKTQSFVARVERHGRRIDVVEFLEFCEVLGLDPAKIIRKIQAVARD